IMKLINIGQYLISTTFAIVLLLSTACGKKGIIQPEKKDLENNIIVSNDTLININYESGILNSGIPGVTATFATASDAAYLISPGRTGNYAIAHKVIKNDNTYYSF